MKTIWVKAIPWEKDIAMAALECGADALWVPSGMEQEVKKMGIIPTVSEHGDLRVGRDVVVVTNLAPAKIFGVESNGMILAAGDAASLLVPLRPVEPGSKIR